MTQSEYKQLANALAEMDEQQLESLESLVNVGQFPAQLGNMSAIKSAIAKQRAERANVVMVDSYRAPVSEATLDVTFTRKRVGESVSLGVLPVAFFGALEYESDFYRMMAPYLPVGVTYTMAKSANGQDLVFTYTDGTNTETITVSLSEAPYTNFLRGLLGTYMKIQQTKIQISDVAVQNQFSQGITTFHGSQWGKTEFDKINPSTFKSDLQNQNDIRTITAVYDIDRERGWIFNIVGENNFTLTASLFVQAYHKGEHQGKH